MPRCETLNETLGRAGVWSMRIGPDGNFKCHGGPRDHVLVSDGKTQWLGHEGKYHSEFNFTSGAWVYEPTDFKWQEFAKAFTPPNDRKLLLCATQKLRSPTRSTT